MTSGQAARAAGFDAEGVHPELVASSTLESAYENVNEEQLARAYIERKRNGAAEGQKGTARTMRRLIAAGFTPPTVLQSAA